MHGDEINKFPPLAEELSATDGSCVRWSQFSSDAASDRLSVSVNNPVSEHVLAALNRLSMFQNEHVKLGGVSDCKGTGRVGKERMSVHFYKNITFP